jgi:hypothetical protein
MDQMRRGDEILLTAAQRGPGILDIVDTELEDGVC